MTSVSTGPRPLTQERSHTHRQLLDLMRLWRELGGEAPTVEQFIEWAYGDEGFDELDDPDDVDGSDDPT